MQKTKNTIIALLALTFYLSLSNSCKKDDPSKPVISFIGDTISYGYDTLVLKADSNMYYNFKIDFKVTRGFNEIDKLYFSSNSDIRKVKRDTTKLGKDTLIKLDTVKTSLDFKATSFKEILPFNSDIYTSLNFKLIKGNGKYEWEFYVTDVKQMQSDKIKLVKYIRIK